MITMRTQLVYGLRFTVRKSVIIVWHDRINRQLDNRSLATGEKPSLTQFCPLWHGPNGLVMNFMIINAFLPIRAIGLTVILSLMAILLRHGEVPCDAVLISRRRSNFANFPYAKFPREPSVTF
jgi:hypothetical protein